MVGSQDAGLGDSQPSLRCLSPPPIQMVIPGDSEEMRAFQSRALALSRCSLEVVLPSAHVFLPSKEVYESLYNRWRRGQGGGWQGVGRGGPGWASLTTAVHLSTYLRINNDLLMWEPADLVPAPEPAAHPSGYPGPSGFWHDNFKMCKSAFKLGRMGILVGARGPRSWAGLG